MPLATEREEEVRQAVADAIEESSVEFEVRVTDRGIVLEDEHGIEFLLPNPVEIDEDA